MPSYTKPTDTANKVNLESNVIYALWTYKRAHAGQEAELEVKTSLVGNGAKIKITCKNESGKKLDKAEGVIFNNRFDGKVLIPDNVKPDDMVFFEAELPKHGLKIESNSIPVRPAITVSALQWDRKEVKRKDVVTLSCNFQSGVEDGDEATVLVYEHNPNSCDIKVVSIPTVIQGNKIELQWEFDYQGDTSLIPTDEDLKPYSKKYANPQYYFVVVVDGVKIGEKRESGMMAFKDRMEISLNADKKADRKYTLTLPDGKQRKGSFDKDGKAREENLPPGPSVLEIELEADEMENEEPAPEKKESAANKRSTTEKRSDNAGSGADPKAKGAHILEFEDTLFRLKSSAMLPEGQAPSTSQVSEGSGFNGINAVASILEFLKGSDRALLVTGHTDTSGSDEYNEKLSLNRAGCVYAAVVGDRDLFKAMANGPHLSGKDERYSVNKQDHIQIADWAANRFGWPCSYAGNGNDYFATVKQFQKSYNANSHAGNSEVADIDPDGDWGPLTWGAVFDCYELELCRHLKIERSGLSAYRDQFDWQKQVVYPMKPYVGCGEYHPVDKPEKNDSRNQTNRRVVAYIFDSGEEPDVSCFSGVCAKKECELFDQSKYPTVPIPVDTGDITTKVFRIRLHDKNSKLMPGAKYRATFPGDMSEGTSDTQAWIQIPVSAVACFEKITVQWGDTGINGFIYSRDLLIDCASGDVKQQARAKLHNLGYQAEYFTLEESVWAFQANYKIDGEYGLDDDGNLPAKTKEMLWSIYENGCDASC
jgi:outer membrane protein OmpA-like peptidoglycan-associated protein